MKPSIKKILDHPDRDEIISKLVIGISTDDINEWLKTKYSNIGDSKFIISAKSLDMFKEDHLDMYQILKQDMLKAEEAKRLSTEDKLQLAIKGNSSYKNKLLEYAGKELDIKEMVTRMCVAIEERASQIFDAIQEDPNSISSKNDKILIDYFNTLGGALEKLHKFTTIQPNTVINNNVTLQVVDQHISVFHDVIKEVLSQMDLDTSLYFVEVFNEKMGKLKPPAVEKDNFNTDLRFAEAKILTETLSKRLDS